MGDYDKHVDSRHWVLEEFRKVRAEIAEVLRLARRGAAGGVPAGAVFATAGTVAPDGYYLCDGSPYDPDEDPALFAAIGNIYGGTLAAPLLPNLKGRVIVGVDGGQVEFDTVGGAGGTKTHTLSEAEMPVHTHLQNSHNHSQNSHNHDQNSHTHSNTLSNASAASTSHSHGLDNSSTFATFTATDTALRFRSRSSVSWTTDRIAPLSTSGGSFTNGFGLELRGSSNGPSTSVTTTINNASTTAVNQATTATNNATTATNQNAGGGQAHNNLQPYRAMHYIIKR